MQKTLGTLCELLRKVEGSFLVPERIQRKKSQPFNWNNCPVYKRKTHLHVVTAFGYRVLWWVQRLLAESVMAI